MASGRMGTSRVGRVLGGGRREWPFGPARWVAFGMVLERGLFFAEGTSFRVVRIPVSFLVPPGAAARPFWSGPEPIGRRCAFAQGLRNPVYRPTRVRRRPGSRRRRVGGQAD